MKKVDDQSDFWDRYSKDFDAIYTHDKSRFQNMLDRVFRKDMYERFQFTMQESQPILDKSILDVGCGSGIYSLAYARQGAKKVVGIDYSKKMIQLANARLESENLEENCEFQVSDIMNYNNESKFDISIAIGLFDYTEDPNPILNKMRKMTNEKMILSFPRLYTWRAPVRKIRLMMKKLDVYFYSKKKLESIFNSLGLTHYKIEKVGKLNCVVLDLTR
jgi:2-polyprenyl-3-methyl-5-hydroxy-6-metoxy-1,4-benzoquinol methylase